LDISTILNSIYGIVLGLIIYIYNQDKKRIEGIEQESKEIKQNYLSRFEDLKEDNTNKHIELLGKINELKIELNKKN